MRLLTQRYEVPFKFLDRVADLMGRSQAESLMNDMAAVQVRDTVYEVDGDQLLASHAPNALWVSPREVVGAMSAALPEGWELLDAVYDRERVLRVDVATPRRKRSLWGGDPATGDLTGAGLRLEQPITQAQYRQPVVSGLLYRLACTNGYEWADSSGESKVTGTSVDEVLESIERLANAYLSGSARVIESFYDLRQVQVAHPERWLARVARERGIPGAVLRDLEARVAADLVDGEITEFDLVNLISNEALNPDIAQGATRRSLERAAGNHVIDHAARCRTCLSRLN
jgi:hypothetical protein